MKKILFLIVILLPLTFISCSKNDDDKDSPKKVMVNIYMGEDLASPSLVSLYDYETAKDFDTNGTSQMGNYQKLVDKSGNEIKPRYTSDSFTGVNIINNVKDGKYMLVVFYKPSGFTWPMFYFYGYKVLDVNADNNTVLYKIQFKYDDRGKFVRF